MNNNLREDPIAIFGAQPWLLPKRNLGGALLPEEVAQDQVTAEWANQVDAALRQANEACNGLPVNAANIQGRLRGARRGTQAQGDELRLELFSGLAEGHWLHVEATAYGSDNDGEHFVLALSSRLFQRQDDQVTEQAVLVDSTLHVTEEIGGTVDFQLLGESPDLLVAQVSVDASVDVDWLIDFTLRAVPGPLIPPTGVASLALPAVQALAVPAAQEGPPGYLVGELPTGGGPGQTVWASDARKQGEKTKQGTGVLAYWDGAAWRRLRDDKPLTT